MPPRDKEGPHLVLLGLECISVGFPLENPFPLPQGPADKGCADSWTTDTHHPLLPLDSKIENIPLEVERQQGWGPDWGGNGDREEV